MIYKPKQYLAYSKTCSSLGKITISNKYAEAEPGMQDKIGRRENQNWSMKHARVMLIPGRGKRKAFSPYLNNGGLELYN